MVPVVSEHNLNEEIGEFYKTLNLAISRKPRVLPPVKDEFAYGVVLPVTWPCFYDNQLLGVMGLDIHFSDVVEGFTYFNKTEQAYAFLIDKNGNY